ncbi:MAG: mechanosensitive ion channel [Maricaulaceae bacterium]
MENIKQSLADFLPQQLGWAIEPLIALITVIIGYIVAKILQSLVSNAINRTGIAKKAQSTGGNMGKSLAKAVFSIVWLFFILLGLGQLQALGNTLDPINKSIDNIVGYLPLLGGGIIVFSIGMMLAKVVKDATTSMLEAAQVDKLASRFEFAGKTGARPSSQSIASSIGNLASAFIIFLFAGTAITIWKIPVISGMIVTILEYIPNIFGATIIIVIATFIGRFVSKLIQNTLPALGLDESLKSVGSLDGESEATVVPSKIIATIAFVTIVLIGLQAAMNQLGIQDIKDVFDTLLGIGGRVVLGAVIIGVGLFIANFVSNIVTQAFGDLAGKIIKYATIVLVTFMGLNSMELGSDIVEAAFNYSVMAAAVAAGVGGALAFGLGGKEWAAKKLEEWMPTKTKPKAKTPAATRRK